jgi:hypothetical protein
MGNLAGRGLFGAAALAGAFLSGSVFAASVRPASGGWGTTPFCESHEYLCTENQYNYDNGKRIGHDEPAVGFYSSTPGAGNANIYNLILPKDPPKLPNQQGTGGTFNFQLHPAFWFGMVMCDTQSFPEFTSTCVADTDANIFDNSDPNAADYIGKHPGAAYMEMQFYPPGWATSCDGKHWCAALTIDSFNFDPNNGIQNNADCLNKVSDEPVNFAFITKTGVSDSAADPLQPEFGNLSTDLLMNPGDNITVDMHDTTDGFEAVIYDNTTHQHGSMKASTANGFAQVNFAPQAATCTSTLYAFHPMYATSGPHTHIPWAANPDNIRFSDEIGHFAYCDSVDNNGVCTQPAESDMTICAPPSASPRVKVGGCVDTDVDFDGVPYTNSWPGTGTNAAMDKSFHPQPIAFTSPLVNPTTPGPLESFDTQAFAADTPIIEPSNVCDVQTGDGCTMLPPGAPFYPFFSIGNEKNGACTWRLGGQSIAGTTNDFGGLTEYGNLLAVVKPGVGGTVSKFEDFHSTAAPNPCNAVPPMLTIPTRPISFGTVRTGHTSPARSLPIANRTLIPIELSGISLPPDYQLGSKTTCPNPGVLAPGGKCVFSVTLTPSVTGADNGSATIGSNASNAGSVSLVGKGK